MGKIIALGIESTAHTFGAAIVAVETKASKGSSNKSIAIHNPLVLSNVKDTFTTTTGGIIPAKAAEHHAELCGEIVEKALKEAKVKLDDVDLIAYSDAPGLGHTLRIGCAAARSLSYLHKKPLVGVNHCIAHLEIGRMLFPECKDPVLLYCSGANTQIIAYEAKKYRIFGETLDIGIGNLLDSYARHIGLGFPGGPKLEKMAQIEANRKAGPRYVELPYAVKGMDVSFGGILTNVSQKHDSKKHDDESLAYSLQETVFAMLLEVSERAMAHCGKKELLLGGGVACNSRLQEMAKTMCEERGAKCFIPERQFLVDNAAMIAWTGFLMNKAGHTTNPKAATIKPYERTDDVLVDWR